jgi:undecaprenyl-diphosphatase
MGLLEAIILSIIEGLTEFLPVSSTGHMILASAAMGMEDDAFVKTFEISIQLGAIAAIALMYIDRFLRGIDIYLKLFVAFLPTAIVGLLAYKTIKELLFNSTVVAISLIIGGVIIILLDRRVEERGSDTLALEELSYARAFRIGLIQCLSMIPGTSRAAATIIGGVFNGLNRKQATEFSFLLAVPTMVAATGYDLLKTSADISGSELQLLGIGLAGAFISAWFAVRLFVKWVSTHGFAVFGYYRIVLGVLFLVFMA